jgi:hypothetical protein
MALGRLRYSSSNTQGQEAPIVRGESFPVEAMVLANLARPRRVASCDLPVMIGLSYSHVEQLSGVANGCMSLSEVSARKHHGLSDILNPMLRPCLCLP